MNEYPIVTETNYPLENHDGKKASPDPTTPPQEGFRTRRGNDIVAGNALIAISEIAGSNPVIPTRFI